MIPAVPYSNSLGDQLVIIVGRGHSGTRAISRTLLESGVFMGAKLNETYDLVPPDSMYEACRLVGRHVVHRGGTEWDFSRLHEIEVEPRFERLVMRYAASVLEHPGPRGWKLPETTLALPWIARLFSDAYFVYWVRDPRDVVMRKHITDELSHFGVPHQHTDDSRMHRAISWKYQREIVMSTPKPIRWIEIRFEDFVLDQERTLERLQSFLGIPLVRVEVRPEAVGRWKADPKFRDFEFLQDDLIALRYTDLGHET